ncbi:uncharacterized protein [Prorops nasuta]|uniref:uncharacterized protein n=1 Tax=Prorops nasuta TaxID=863751 RepID=UPI0034D003D6
MPHPCVVCGRSRMNPNNREEEYMFFGFPVNDEARCTKWLEFCCRDDLYKLTKKQLLQRMVCSKHFEPRDFLNEYLDRLNCTAVPTIYDPKQSLYNITCVLCGRTRKDPPDGDYDGATFHHFPGEEFRCLKWLDFVGVDSYYRLTRKEILFCYICSKHFDQSQFMSGYKSRLVDNAVPNIRYPDQIDKSEQYITEYSPEETLTSLPEKVKLEPLPQAVFESQACAACGRSRSDPRNKEQRYKFHPFPAYEIGRCLRWCQFLGREDLLKMSPNQIRKLVLCSKHFQTGQSFHKVGPCDAVPTIRDISENSSVVNVEIFSGQEIIEDSSCPNTVKGSKRQSFSRPLVSSKKPKIDNKPAPLAKKRGKSKRPTSINIPKPDLNNLQSRTIRKLPLPPATNWKILSNQFQPITINNITPNITNNITGEVRKVILPFTGDISNLGTPIPVHSLSSIPPGFLIKINLPEQEQKSFKQTKSQVRGRHVLASNSDVQQKNKNGKISTNANLLRGTIQATEENFSEFLSFSTESVIAAENPEEMEEQQEVLSSNDLSSADLEYLNTNEMEVKEEFYEEYIMPEEEEEVKLQSVKKRKKIRKFSGTLRRTVLPIRSEVQYFLKKLTPYMHRLPRKARAQIKLSIVNMVIDNL